MVEAIVAFVLLMTGEVIVQKLLNRKQKKEFGR